MPHKLALLSTLSDRFERSRAPRHLRIWKSPVKTILPKLLRLTGMRLSCSAETFWGRNLTVWLPEGVSTALWRHGFFEYDVCVALLRLLDRGMTFVDVGSHFGFFTLLGEHLVGPSGQVLSIEPSPETFKVLQRNLSDDSVVNALNVAAHSEKATLSLYDFGLAAAGYNSLMFSRQPEITGPPKRKVQVRGVPLERLVTRHLASPPDLIKIDVESAELEVLKGVGSMTLSAGPMFIVEVGDIGDSIPGRSRKVVDWFISRSYRVFEVEDGSFVAHRPQDVYKHMNLVFMPDSNGI